MSRENYDLPSGYLRVKVPGGFVEISTDLIDVQSEDPVVRVDVVSEHEERPDSDGLRWEVQPPSPHRPGIVRMRGTKPGAKG